MKTIYTTLAISLLVLLYFISFGISVQAQTVIINAPSTWKYLDNGSNQNTSWLKTTFDDATWLTGLSVLGYGNSPETELEHFKIGYYFRKTVDISNPLQFSDFTMKIRRDDGIVIYINNVEVYRNNMPPGIISYDTKAVSACSDDGNAVFTQTLSNSLFIAGNNTIAAEVHNWSTLSSDITFELQLIGNLLPIVTCITPNENLFGNSNVTATTAEAFWVPVSGVQSYNVEYRIRNVGASYSSPIIADSASIVLINLQPSTNYEFIVQSNCPGGGVSSFSQSGWISTLDSTGPPPTCGIPDANTFGSNNISSTSATIFWTAITGAQSYNFEYRDFNSTVIYSTPINTTSDSIVLNNLQPATGYEFIVQSVCPGNVVSAFSSSRFIGTLYNSPPPTCGIPDTALFGRSNITPTSAELNWVSITGAQSYNVEYRILNSGANYSAPINAASASIALTNLQPSTNYEFIIQSVCSDSSMSAFTQSRWFTTLAISGSSATLLRGPYMPIATSTGITIQWRTNIATSTEVKYDTTSILLNHSVNNLIVSTEHSITLNGLLPNTKYYYSIGPVGYVLQGDNNNYFYTAPVAGSTQPVKFWVTGDFGNGGAGQIAVRNSFSNHTSGQIVNGWLWLGDNAYNNGTDQEYQAQVFDVYNTLFKNIPVFPTPGNHDYAQSGYQSAASLSVNFPYFNIFTLPTAAGTEKYYSTNYGNIHFISLDSYGSYNNSSSAMYNWLSNDLVNNIQQWTIVYFHHPPYSKGSHNSDTEVELIDMRNNIIPLLESFGVDLVLGGHSHIYERSYFIKGHTGLENTFNSSLYPVGNIVEAGGGPYTKSTRTGNGTVYVVCGVSGQPGGTTMPGYPHNAMYKSIISNNGSLILDVTSGNLTCKFLTSSNSIADQFTIQKPLLTPIVYAREFRPFVELETGSLIYPNPSLGDINIRINNPEEIQITVSVYNLEGSILFKRTYSKVKDDNILIEKSETNLSPGIYILNVNGENINISNKLVMY